MLGKRIFLKDGSTGEPSHMYNVANTQAAAALTSTVTADGNVSWQQFLSQHYGFFSPQLLAIVLHANRSQSRMRNPHGSIVLPTL